MQTHHLTDPLNVNETSALVLRFGPTELIANFIKKAVLSAQKCGVTLYLRRDLNDLVKFNGETENWYPLIPFFRPEHGLLNETNSFWIEGRDRDGNTVATQAARCFDWTGTDLSTELSSMRAIYADPKKNLEMGERWDVSAPSGKLLHGRTVFSGGGWYHPRFRGIGLSRILPRISRALSLSVWNTDFTFSIVEPVFTRNGVVRNYGYTNIEHGVHITKSFRGDVSADLIWMSRKELIADLQANSHTP